MALLREYSQIRRLRVEGHTDTRGDVGHNQRLSRRRAQAVAEYLRGHGFESIQFEAVGNGPSQPPRPAVTGLALRGEHPP